MWVQWIDNAVYNNAVYPRPGKGDNWRFVIDEAGTDVINKAITIVEEDNKLYRRVVARDLTYVEQRLSEYPHVRDQLDMLYKDTVNGTTTWKDAIAAIKSKYPKE